MEMSAWIVPLVLSVITLLMFGSFLLGRNMLKRRFIESSNGTLFESCQFGSSNIERFILSQNEENLPTDVVEALNDNRAVSFSVSAYIQEK